MELRPKVDLGNECLVLESVEDNERITSGSVSEKLKNVSNSNSYTNGSAVVENGDNNELIPDGKQKGPEVMGSVNSSIPAEFKPEQSARMKKGAGLRKWRRIRRDPNKGSDSGTNPDKMVTQDLLDSGANSSKRMLVNNERKEKSVGSVSSTNAVLGRSGLPFSAGTDSESSGHQSSKSSTAASTPKVKYEMGVNGGFPRNKSRMRSLSGKNLTSSVQRGQQQGKVRIETTKKVRGEQGNVEKENSLSSMESDSRSSNFVFVNGTYSASNGWRNERPKNSEGENGDEAQGSQGNISDGNQGGYGKDGGEDYDDLSPKGVVGDSAWDVEEDGNMNSSLRIHNALADSIFALKAAQDALEREVLKFKDVGSGTSADDSVLHLHMEFIPYGMAVNSLPQADQSKIVGEAKGDLETELEDLFTQKVEAEVEYLVISRAVQKLRVSQIMVLEEQKALASEQTHILNELGNTEKKATIMKKEAEKLERVCEDIARVDKILNLQKKFRKYSLCFLVQLVAFVVIITIFIHRVSLDYTETVPT